ncbi:unnamed protein product [Clonostachys rosea f. rosea IK726]|uniref:Uncharacterized protein n=2 Tax=Bionectria ochroleuca TaxID=29856 RepID=A0A0B7JTQ0_BIOOC|nr:unnamed protein product [Clonostachys rosea f. rosea IK726]
MAACSDSWLGQAGWTPHCVTPCKGFGGPTLGPCGKQMACMHGQVQLTLGMGFSSLRVEYDGFRLEDRVDNADMDIGN